MKNIDLYNMEELREKYSNDNTYYKEIVNLINTTKTLSIDNKEPKLRKYRDELMRIKEIREDKLENQVANTRELENYMSSKDMIKHWEKMEQSCDKLMFGFYLFYPPLRSDWSSISIENNKFVFEKYLKTKESKDLTKEIIPELQHLIVYVNQIPRDNKVFCKKLIRITKRVTGKSIGVNMFRKIHIFEHRDDSLKDRKVLADHMNHTVRTSRLYYEKRNFK